MSKTLAYNKRKYLYHKGKNGVYWLFIRTKEKTWRKIDRFSKTKEMMDYIYEQKRG